MSSCRRGFSMSGQGDVQQHRWTGLKGHSERCHGQVRRRRQVDAEEGPQKTWQLKAIWKTSCEMLISSETGWWHPRKDVEISSFISFTSQHMTLLSRQDMGQLAMTYKNVPCQILLAGRKLLYNSHSARGILWTWKGLGTESASNRQPASKHSFFEYPISQKQALQGMVRSAWSGGWGLWGLRLLRSMSPASACTWTLSRPSGRWLKLMPIQAPMFSFFRLVCRWLLVAWSCGWIHLTKWKQN